MNKNNTYFKLKYRKNKTIYKEVHKLITLLKTNWFLKLENGLLSRVFADKFLNFANNDLVSLNL